MTNNDEMMKIPEGFPVVGNKETLKMMQPIFMRLVGNEKVLTCATINALTVNLKVTPTSRMHNSNFIVMGSGLGKTAYIKMIEKDNKEHILKMPAGYVESYVRDKDKQDFLGKTWVSYDCAPAFVSSTKKEASLLVDFYTASLSDGVFGIGMNEVHTNYNILYAINNEIFDKVFPLFKERNLLERIVPIFFYPTKADLDKISEINESKIIDMPIKLPYIDEIDNDKKLDFKIDKTLDDDIYNLTNDLKSLTGNSGVRCQQYIWQFLSSNALINDRINNVYGKKYITPDYPDIDMLKWVIDVHARIPKDFFEYLIYQVFANTSMTFSLEGVLQRPEIVAYAKNKNKSGNEVMTDVQFALKSLSEKGLLKKKQKFYYNPYFFGADF